ncbi:hypothetical protein [Dolichospermum sp. UHCC 0259]|uniref:hypothetical protein n=1 Tax=Dolichospermum sp. UHCC 0259 TaxID=2590010 RepID=UPI001445E9FE|nr:hypothetical protein [Dolichospermum sp. UHCC 0259]
MVVNQISAINLLATIAEVRSQESGVRSQELRISYPMAFTTNYVSHASAYRYIIIPIYSMFE